MVASILWRLQWQKASRETEISSVLSLLFIFTFSYVLPGHASLDRLTPEAAIARNRKPSPSTPIQHPWPATQTAATEPKATQEAPLPPSIDLVSQRGDHHCLDAHCPWRNH